MSDGYKGQIPNAIQFGGVKSQMISELKKAISRVPFKSDYEVRFRFPEYMFQHGSLNSIEELTDVESDREKLRVKNPLSNMAYNKETIKYIEERIPFLTKSVSGFDQSIKEQNINILNRSWAFPSKLDFSDLSITFYDMYVQGIDEREWVSVSELFKVWIDNIFFNSQSNTTNIDGQSKSSYVSYSNVVNYYDEYAINYLDLYQFTRKLEIRDLENMFKVKNTLIDLKNKSFNTFKYRRDKNYYKKAGWDDGFKKQSYLAQYLNDLQEKRKFNTGIIGTIGSVLEPLNSLLTTLYTASDVIGNFQKNQSEDVKKFNEFMENMAKYVFDEYYTNFDKLKQSCATLPLGADKDGNVEMYVLNHILNSDALSDISGSAIKNAIDKASQEAEPKFLGIDTPMDEITAMLGFISTAYAMYDAYKLAKWAVFPDSPIKSDWNGEKDSGLVKDDNSMVNKIGQALVGDRFLITNFTDNYVDAILDFLQYNLDTFQNNLSDIEMPFNWDEVEELTKDARFGTSSTIYDVRFEDGTYTSQPIKTFRFYDLYPVRIEFQDFNYDNSDELTTFTVYFKYTHFEQK